MYQSASPSNRGSLQVAEHLAARTRHSGVGPIATGQRRPAAFLDERTLLIRAYLFELDHVRRRFGALLEFVDADRRQGRDERRGGAALDHFFGGAAGDPAAPVEADDQGDNRTRGCTLQQARKRIPPQNCWHFHDVSPSARDFSWRVQRMPEWAPVDAVKLD